MSTGDLPIRVDRLATIASGFAYPRTPDLWSAVQRRLEPETARRKSRGVRSLAYALGILLVVLAMGLAAAPEARAALLRILRVGVVRVFLPETTSTPTRSPANATPEATMTPRVSTPPLDLAGPTTLAAAEDALGSPILRPTYPLDLGDPDLVFLQDWEGPLVILVWMRPDHPQQARLALHILGPGTFAGKGAPNVVVTTEVNGNPALWTEGPHQLLLQSGRDTFRNLVTGNVLIWEQDGLTYRLETDRSMDEAIRTAESLR